MGDSRASRKTQDGPVLQGEDSAAQEIRQTRRLAPRPNRRATCSGIRPVAKQEHARLCVAEERSNRACRHFAAYQYCLIESGPRSSKAHLEHRSTVESDSFRASNKAAAG